MSCVNTKSKEYQDLVSNFPENQKISVEVYTKRFMDKNSARYPTLIELKAEMADTSSNMDMEAFYAEARDIVKSLLPGLSADQLNQKLKFMDKLNLVRLRNGKDVLSTFIDWCYIVDC